MENKISIIVFDFFEKGNLEKAVQGKPVGTLVSDFPKGSELY